MEQSIISLLIPSDWPPNLKSFFRLVAEVGGVGLHSCEVGNQHLPISSLLLDWEKDSSHMLICGFVLSLFAKTRWRHFL